MKTEQIEKNELIALSSKELASVMYQPFPFALEKPFHKRIMLIRTAVAGANHVERIQSYLRSVHEDDRLTLRREPENMYDSNAILVFSKTMRKLGYVPRRDNKVIASLMDAGKSVYALVDEVRRGKTVERTDPFHMILISIFMED